MDIMPCQHWNRFFFRLDCTLKQHCRYIHEGQDWQDKITKAKRWNSRHVICCQLDIRYECWCWCYKKNSAVTVTRHMSHDHMCFFTRVAFWFLILSAMPPMGMLGILAAHGTDTEMHITSCCWEWWVGDSASDRIDEVGESRVQHFHFLICGICSFLVIALNEDHPAPIPASEDGTTNEDWCRVVFVGFHVLFAIRIGWTVSKIFQPALTPAWHVNANGASSHQTSKQRSFCRTAISAQCIQQWTVKMLRRPLAHSYPMQYQ